MASAKGGAGKTMLTASIGAFLAGIGKKVLLVDTDASTNGLTLLYFREVAIAADDPIALGMFDDESGSMQRPPTVVGLVYNLDLVPAAFRFGSTVGLSLKEFEVRVHLLVSTIAQAYDYVIFDAQAGSDAFACTVMKKGISDTVVLVAEYDPMSAAGIERLKGIRREDLTYGRTWILLNKVLPEFAQSFSEFLEVARYLSPIPWEADVVRAYARRKLALDIEFGNTFTIAIVQVARSLFDESMVEIDAWVRTRGEVLRAPVRERYDELEQELGHILEQSGSAWRLQQYLSVYLVRMVGVVCIAAIYVSLIPSEARSSNNLVKQVLVGGLALVTIAALFWQGRSTDTLATTRLLRRRAVVEDELKQLEVLRVADPETLLSARMRRTPKTPKD